MWIKRYDRRTLFHEVAQGSGNFTKSNLNFLKFCIFAKWPNTQKITIQSILILQQCICKKFNKFYNLGGKKQLNIELKNSTV